MPIVQRCISGLVAICAMLGSGPTSAADASALTALPGPTVILISLDGTRPVDVRPEIVPSLVALAEGGVVAERLIPAVPTNTFPNHVTLVTGVRPERHGLVNNRFRDAEKGVFTRKNIPDWIEVEPLWSILQGAGIQSASYYWVGSEGAWQNGRGPLHWKPFSSRTRELTKVHQILRWLDLPEAAGRPHFITSWFHGADHAGHDHGPDSDEAKKSLAAQDSAILALVQGLEKRGLFSSTTLIFVSDHGMTRAEKEVDLGSALEAAGLPVHVYGIGGFAIVTLRGKASGDPAVIGRVVEVARALGLDAFARREAPPGAHVGHPRFGDVIVRAPIGLAIVRPGLRIEGFHGYAPEAAEMSALFIAAGRGVPKGLSLGAIHSIDVAPTVLGLLGVPVPEWMEGRPIRELVPGIDPPPSPPSTPAEEAARTPADRAPQASADGAQPR